MAPTTSSGRTFHKGEIVAYCRGAFFIPAVVTDKLHEKYDLISDGTLYFGVDKCLIYQTHIVPYGLQDKDWLYLMARCLSYVARNQTGYSDQLFINKVPTPEVPKCQCGAAKLGYNSHSDWCCLAGE